MSKSWFPMRNDILYNKHLSTDAKILLAVLYRHKNNGDVTKKTNKELSALSTIHYKNIHRYIKELEGNKLIVNCCKKGQDGEYGILYKPYMEKGDYSKLQYDFITKYPNEVIIDYFQFINLYRIKEDIKEITATTLVQSNWTTIADVIEVIQKLERFQLLKFKCEVLFTSDSGIDMEIKPESSGTELSDAEEKSPLVENDIHNNISEIKKEPAVICNEQQEFNNSTDIIENSLKDIIPLNDPSADIDWDDDISDEDWLDIELSIENGAL